jgi:hypothetical protein
MKQGGEELVARLLEALVHTRARQLPLAREGRPGLLDLCGRLAVM